MADTDEHEHISAESVSITTPHIVVNMGWSPRAVLLNNLFSGTGALGGMISVLITIYVVFIRG